MADYWTTPETGWTAMDGIGYGDLNRIEANISANRDGNFRKVQGFGYIVANGSPSTITIQPGSCYSENGYPIRRDTVITKNLNAWAQGSGSGIGGMAPSVVSADITWYYAFIIMDPTDGSTDVMFDSDPAGGNVSSGTFTEKRFIGAYKTGVSSTLMEMYSTGDHVFINPTYAVNNRCVYNNSLPINNAYRTITLSTTLPTSFGMALPARNVLADLNILSEDVDYGLISTYSSVFTAPSPFLTLSDPQGEFCYLRHGAGLGSMDLSIMVDSASQIKLAMYEASYGGSVDIRVRGFHDERLI